MYGHSAFYKADLQLSVLYFWWKQEHGEKCLNEYFANLTDLPSFECLLDGAIGEQVLSNLCMKPVWEIILNDKFLRAQFDPSNKEMIKSDLVHRFVGARIKSTQWWKTNKDALKKLSAKVKKVRKVMES